MFWKKAKSQQSAVLRDKLAVTEFVILQCKAPLHFNHSIALSEQLNSVYVTITETSYSTQYSTAFLTIANSVTSTIQSTAFSTVESTVSNVATATSVAYVTSIITTTMNVGKKRTVEFPLTVSTDATEAAAQSPLDMGPPKAVVGSDKKLDILAEKLERRGLAVERAITSTLYTTVYSTVKSVYTSTVSSGQTVYVTSVTTSFVTSISFDNAQTTITVTSTIFSTVTVSSSATATATATGSGSGSSLEPLESLVATAPIPVGSIIG
jgi:hypothetical protein